MKASYARKAGGSAICKKREENSLAALPIVYLFFIIYQKSRVWTITRLENLSGVYVKRYWFSIFVVVDRCLLYSKTSRQIGAVEAFLPSVNKHKNH